MTWSLEMKYIAKIKKHYVLASREIEQVMSRCESIIERYELLNEAKAKAILVLHLL